MMFHSSKIKTDKSQNTFSGFTYIELLVVIVVLAILAGVVSIYYVNSQKRAYDSLRTQEIRNIQTGFEIYFSKNDSKYADTCEEMIADDILFPGSKPQDPTTGNPYSYTNCTPSSYCICAELEITPGNSDDTACGFDNSGDETYYCLEDLITE